MPMRASDAARLVSIIRKNPETQQEEKIPYFLKLVISVFGLILIFVFRRGDILNLLVALKSV